MRPRPIRTLCISWCVLIIALLAMTSFPSQAMSTDLYFVDAHSQADEHIDLEEIIKLMNKAGVSRTILSNRGARQPEELISFALRHQDRITPAVRTKGGMNLPKKRFRQFFRKQMRMAEFGAMAEVLMWHEEKTSAPSVALGSGKTGPPPKVVFSPDHPRVQSVLNMAIRKEWPFIVHIEFAAVGFERGAFMRKFKSLLTSNSEHPFALIHMGYLETEDVRRLIDDHPNIYFITSWSNSIVVKLADQLLTNLFEGTRLTPEWKKLIVRHPDRFILGFDNVFAGHWRKLYRKQVALWRKALNELPEEVAHAVAHGNAERLWRLPPAQ